MVDITKRFVYDFDEAPATTARQLSQDPTIWISHDGSNKPITELTDSHLMNALKRLETEETVNLRYASLLTEAIGRSLIRRVYTHMI